ncbi:MULTISPECIES: hypothetical protein [Paenibacillus]|uniref:Tail tape measure protein n=1 Tax=Paenibacillus albilobatus TaxID=2716884 RepID=A0A919XGZ2_9BACL|nr:MULTISPECIES: hypothetical protein [Paenibacillus]GIO32011.1 hypothetical protein J2TS6_31520 [Paenibacillus albilobatus]
MAETMNYRMNLVIDPKNVIKANRELRAMERYFERIQGRVLRIGRTRMAPEIVLKDRASKGLDNLLRKLQRVRSEVINASGTVTLRVEQQGVRKADTSKQSRVESSKLAVKSSKKFLQTDTSKLVEKDTSKLTQTDTSSQVQMDTSTLVKTLEDNTNAVNGLTNAIGNLQFGVAAQPEKKPRSIWDQIKDGFSVAKSIGGGVKSATEIPGKFKKIGEALEGKDLSTGKLPEGQPFSKGKRIWNTVGATGDLFGTIGSAGESLMGGMEGFFNLGKEVIGDTTSSATSIINPKGGPASSAASIISPKAIGSAAETAGKSVLGGASSGLLKGGMKKLLGPLGFAVDAMSITTAKPGKERAEAIGSAAGGTIGSILGGAVGSLIPIPGVGTILGSTVGGAVGDFVGGKIGGFVSDSIPKVKDWFSNTFSFGKKKKPKEEDVAQKPAVISGPSIPQKQPVPVSTSIMYGAALSASAGALPMARPNVPGPGPRMQSAVSSNAAAVTSKVPQVVQISPEQMTELSGFLRDFKTETTTQYNLPPGAVQVTVHEEYPVDVEGIIQQVGQRLRAEFAKATQNRKPQSMALA